MKLLGIVLFLIIHMAGCATLGQKTTKLDFAEVEGLKIRHSTGSELREKFGDPEQVISLSGDEEAWFYVESGASGPFQRASFVLDKEKKTLLTATWIPDGRDALKSKDTALSYFKNASFEFKEIGWVAGHEFSDEVVYTDMKLGVSIRVNRFSQSVIAIGFGDNGFQSLAKQN